MPDAAAAPPAPEPPPTPAPAPAPSRPEPAATPAAQGSGRLPATGAEAVTVVGAVLLTVGLLVRRLHGRTG